MIFSEIQANACRVAEFSLFFSLAIFCWHIFTGIFARWHHRGSCGMSRPGIAGRLVADGLIGHRSGPVSATTRPIINSITSALAGEARAARRDIPHEAERYSWFSAVYFPSMRRNKNRGRAAIAAAHASLPPRIFSWRLNRPDDRAFYRYLVDKKQGYTAMSAASGTLCADIISCQRHTPEAMRAEAGFKYRGVNINSFKIIYFHHLS